MCCGPRAPALHLQMDALRRDLRCDLGRKRSSFFREMTPTQTSRRAFTSATFTASLLALVALLVAGAGISDYPRIQENIARSRVHLTEADATLAQVAYDGQGNVVQEDRGHYQHAMTMMQVHTDSIRSSRAQEADVYPFVGGGILGFLVFVIVAVRSTRKPTTSST